MMNDAKTTADSDSDRRGIQSVEIGLRVIDALRNAGGSLPLKALASASRLSGSNCHRYCVSFVRTGWMKQDARSGRYELGARLIDAGMTALSRTDPIGAATEALEHLVEATGNTGQLAIWGDHGPTIVRWMTGRMAVHTSAAAGSTLPLLTSATGRVFLGFLPARQTAALLDRERKTVSFDGRALAEQTRAAGLAHVSGDHIPGLDAVAAPVLDVHGEAAAVMTLISAGGAIAPDAIDRLRLAAAAASTELGWTAAVKAQTVLIDRTGGHEA